MRRASLILACLALPGASLAGQQAGMPIAAPAPIEAACDHTPLSCGASVSGSIEETDCKIANGSYEDVYKLELPTRRVVTIDLASTDFDSFLTIRNEKGMQALPALGNGPLEILIQQDDNGGGGKNARVQVDSERPDTLYVMARGKKGRSRGTYTLTIKCQEP